MMRRLWDKLTDPDRALQAAMGGLIEAAGVRYALDVKQRRYRAGEPLKLSGYQSVAFAPDGKTLAQGGGNDAGHGIIQLWHRSVGN